MLYHLFEFLEANYDLPGTGVFQYISFRAAASVITSLICSMIIGKKVIEYLQLKQVGEIVRDLGLAEQTQKKGTPTMGGIIILSSILIPTILFAQLNNVYVLLMIVSTIWLGTIGFIDDYIKVFKKDKEGLAGRFKIMGQVGISLIVACTLYFNDSVSVKDRLVSGGQIIDVTIDGKVVKGETHPVYGEAEHSLVTTIPFVKDNEFDYSSLLFFLGDKAKDWGWLVFIPIVIFIVTAVSNGANLTDGLDGLATGTSAIIGVTLAAFAYVSGNIIFADYLNIMYIPGSGELVVFISAFIGACIGFLWYNQYPAQVFMGDTGSLALGGIIAVFALAIRKELLIPILCGVFLMENLSVVMQVSYFKYTKKKFGEGRRIFLMSPLHHHFQKKGMHEAKIVGRFWIVGIMLAVLTVVTLKLR
ncbi:MAG: phospho-N-acetylmuramoyl-pentapeptide-transferase [Flavobacteriales bacterium]|jgi:phospho-N-acetylmuramoyl-pentapeptide-transferase|nr:phospho-N-acetylmuramoyl-pentapeptide-transferase [Flavobacteriales bacterium]